MRAAFAVMLLGLAGGVGLATAVLSDAADRPTTVAAALGLDRADPELDGRRAEAVAILTADCMRRHGLHWTAVPELAPAIPDEHLDPVAWARRWGFGLSTMVGRRPDPASVGASAAAMEADDLSVREGYRRALHGVDGSPGCHATATNAVFGARDRLLAPLRPALDALDARIVADPKTQLAAATWRTCVGPVTAGLAADRRSLPGALLERYDAQVRRLAGLHSIAGLAALQADERRVATVVADCEVAFGAARVSAAARHEAAFVAGHRDALASIGAAIRAAEAGLPTLPPPP